MQQNIFISLTPQELDSIIQKNLKKFISVKSEEKEKLSQKEASKFLGVSQPTIINWKKKKFIPFHQIPNTRKIYYLRSELKEAAKQLSNF